MVAISVKPESSWKKPEKHLDVLLNSSWYKILNSLYSSILYATYDFYKHENIQPSFFPITTGAISSPMGLGSDSLPVAVKIRNNNVYLADSMQFCLEIGARLNAKGAYYIMPTFRGENMDARHLNEFIHSEVEIKGCIKDVMQLAELYIKYLINYLLNNNREEISLITENTRHLEQALEREFICLPYEQAIRELQDVPNAIKKLDKSVFDITPEGEKYILHKYGDFTWLTDLPWKLVPFYQAQQPNNSEYAYAADLLAGIGEILGCGQRVLTPQELDKSLAAHNVQSEDYSWYRHMRELRQIQTSGFGMGLERFILWVLKHEDIRDCTILLRDHNKIVGP